MKGKIPINYIEFLPFEALEDITVSDCHIRFKIVRISPSIGHSILINVTGTYIAILYSLTNLN